MCWSRCAARAEVGGFAYCVIFANWEERYVSMHAFAVRVGAGGFARSVDYRKMENGVRVHPASRDAAQRRSQCFA